jgi:hypothetical protein
MSEGWQIGLWLAVIVSGIYHGLNPGMGWPLAVAAGLMERRQEALFKALGSLLSGHLLAMTVVLLPFGILTAIQYWMHEIQVAAAVLVIGVGFLLFLYRRHPRVLARIPPSQLALWSFAVAIAHGAGLMLVPIYLGLCSAPSHAAHEPAMAIMADNIGLAALVSAVHAAAMIAASGAVAWAVYHYVGIQVLSKAWFNLEAFWAASLLSVGLVALRGLV